MNSTYMDTYLKTNGKPSKLDPSLAKDLRSHHSNLGIDAARWDTTYRDQHAWKQPTIEDDN